MSDDTDDTSDESESGAEDVIERGLGAYTAGDILTDMLDSLDVEALADGATFEEAVEYEDFGEALGRLVGYAAARGTSSSGLLGRILKEKAVSEVGGKAGKAAGAAFVEYGDPDALLAYLQVVADRNGLNQLAERLNAATEDTPGDGMANEDIASDDIANENIANDGVTTGDTPSEDATSSDTGIDGILGGVLGGSDDQPDEEWTEIEIEDGED